MGGIFGFGNFGSTNTGFDWSVLNNYYRSKLPVAPSAQPVNRKPPPVSVQYAPWFQKSQLTTDVAKLNDAMATKSFVDLGDLSISRPGVDNDHRKLFALYKGLVRLQALANRSAEDSTSANERNSLNTRFVNGLGEVRTFLSDKGFEDLTLGFGAQVSKVETGFRKVRPPSVYVAPPIVVGQSTDAISGLQGNEKFSVTIGRTGGDLTIAMDLAEIGGTISVDSLIAYMNGKLEQAGVISRFTRTVENGRTPSDPKRISLSIQTVSTERMSFAAEQTKPAIFVGSVVGTGKGSGGVLTKLADDTTGVSAAFSRKIDVTGGAVDIRGTATDAQGNVFVVGSTTEDLVGGIVQGNRDVYLRKYDGAGQLVWSRLLGSSQEASGFAVAVDASGSVAIAGRITDRLTGTSVGGGGDSFVAKYDASGKEVFVRQVAPVTDDTASALAFAADGSLLVAGQTSSAMSSAVTHGGATDAYLMKLSGSGYLEWVRQFGGASSDRATGVAITADGNAVMTSLEGGDAIVRKVGLADGTSAPAWSVNLGAIGQGSVGAVAVDGSSVYVAGTTNNASLNAGGVAPIVSAHAGEADGFVTKIVDDGSAASVAYTTYVGTSEQDSGIGLAVSNGAVYVSGATSGGIDGASTPTASDAYVRKLDANGVAAWTHQFQGSGKFGVANAITVDGQGASVLDRLGLPRGQISFDQSRLITAGSSLRAGDHFFMKVNDGTRLKVTVEAGDTMRSLALKINNSMLLKGTAVVSRTGGDGIRITAKEGNTIELIAGSAGLDALAGLGLEPVKLDANKQTASTAASLRRFSLGLESGMNLEEKIKSKAMVYQLGSALETIKTAYMTITGTSLRSGSQLDQRALSSYQSAILR